MFTIKNSNKIIFCWLLTLAILVVLLISLEVIFFERYKLSKKVLKIFGRKDLKYILLWTNTMAVPFVYIGEGQSGFIRRKCPYTNCYVTGNRSFLKDLTEFDLVAFNAKDLQYIEELPSVRSRHQKYVFVSIESAFNYPICNRIYNNYFNWTFTYKLNSDARFGYIVVRDTEGRVIGPNEEMHWIEFDKMKNITKKVKNALRSKSKLAAWFVSSCITPNNREATVTRLQDVLRAYGLTIDVFGVCGDLKCPREDMDRCLKMLQTDYFFYIAFENSNSEDYVTEKILYGLKNYAVPIVFGGANYTRFMPTGAYLDAGQWDTEYLANYMAQLYQRPKEYEKFFKWRSHYSFHRRTENIDTDDYCNICTMLNNDTLVETETVYENFLEWWGFYEHCPPTKKWYL